MLLAHGFCSSCLFYLLYVMYERFYSRRALLLKGLIILLPVLGYVWFLYCVINMGVPPFFSFFSEVYLLIGLCGVGRINFFGVRVLLLFAGIYGVIMFVMGFHGVGLIPAGENVLTFREGVIIYGHFFYLGVFILCLGYFF